MKRRMWSLAFGLVCAGMALSVSGHAGYAPQRPQAVSSMASLDLKGMKKSITKRFVNAKLTEVLAWLSLEEFSFVADASEFPAMSSVTLNFRSQPLGAVLDAIADAYNGRWERRGDIFTLRPQHLAARNLFTSPVVEGVATTAPGGRFGETPFATQRPGTPAPLTAPTKVFDAPLGSTVPLQKGPGAWVAPSPLAAPGEKGPQTWTVPPVELPAKVQGVPPTVAYERVAVPRFRTDVTAPAKAYDVAPTFTAPPARIAEFYGAQDPKAQEEAMRAAEKALRSAEQEMKRLHESGEWRKMMERAMQEARAHQGQDHQKAMAEARKAMEEARRAMQNMPNSKEWKDAWSKAREEMKQALKKGKVTENGKERSMTAKEKEQLQKAIERFEKMPDMKFDFVMPKLDEKHFIMPKIDEKHFVMPKIDSKVFTVPPLRGNRFFYAPGDPKFDAENKEFKKALEEMNKAMKDLGMEGKGGGRAFTFVAPDGKALKGLGKLDMKALEENMAKLRVEGNRFGNTRPFVFSSEKMRIKELLDSLTPAQREKQEKQGHLSLSDLTPKQREMLGGIPEGDNWTFSYSIDGKKVTIKGK